MVSGHTLSLFIPGLARSFAFESDLPSGDDGKLLLSAFDHCRRRSNTYQDFRQALYQIVFGDDFDVSRHYASICHQAGGYFEKTQNRYLVSPIAMESGLTSLSVTENLDDDLEPSEKALLVDLLNQHFMGEDYHYEMDMLGHIYAVCKTPFEQKMLPVNDVVSQNLLELIDTHNNIKWLALLNELQMLMHDSTLNQDRESEGKMPVQGLWLWGGGEYCEMKPIRPYDFITSDGREGEILAEYLNIPFYELQECPETGTGLILYEQFLEQLNQGTWFDLKKMVKTLEQSLGPILKTRFLDLDLIYSDGVIWHHRPSFWQKLWKRQVDWATVIKESQQWKS